MQGNLNIPTITVSLIILTACNNKKVDKNAVIPQSYLDSVVIAKTDSFKRSLNAKTDSLLFKEANRQLDSIKWRDSLINMGVYEQQKATKDTATIQIKPIELVE